MNRADLLDLIYRFYPRGVGHARVGHDETDERARQLEAFHRGVEDYPRWKALLRRLSERHAIWDWSLHLLSGTWGPAYSGWIYIPNYRLGFHVSLLGPYYGIHRLGVPEEVDAATFLSQEIETSYPGYEPIPPELGEEVVPDVSLSGRGFGKATIYDCLLSQEWESSVPDDGKRSSDAEEAAPSDDTERTEEPSSGAGEAIYVIFDARIRRARFATRDEYLAQLTASERAQFLANERQDNGSK
jgi:hypothetical protein